MCHVNIYGRRGCKLIEILDLWLDICSSHSGNGLPKRITDPSHTLNFTSKVPNYQNSRRFARIDLAVAFLSLHLSLILA